MKIIQSKREQYDVVRKFYHSLIDGMKDFPFTIGWKKDIYPSPEFLRDSILNGELYLGLDGENLVAAMVLNHQYNEGYRKFKWQTDAADSEITVIHALGVHPSHGGKGYAKAMVKRAFEIAKANSQKVIRLDVLARNLPAKKLYAALGFKYMHTLQMFYEDTGWTDFELYEYVL